MGRPVDAKGDLVRKALPGLLLLALAAGCKDQSAVQRANERVAFNKAVAVYEASQQGWVPKDQEVKGPGGELSYDLGAFREERLAKAASELQKFNGSPEQQAAVARMLADVQQAQARYASRKAMTDWAALTERSSKLTNLVAAVDSASIRAAGTTGDKKAVISELDKRRKEVQKDIADATAEAKEHKSKAAELQTQVDKLRASSKSSLENSQKIRQSAFTMTGKAQYEAYLKATDAERASARDSAEAQKLALRAEIASSEAAILQRRVDLDQEAIAATQALADSTRKTEADLKALHDKAEEDRKAKAEMLKKATAEIAAAYDEIDKRFQAADAFADAATKTLANARGAVSRATEIDLLQATVTRAHLLALHTNARASITSTLELVAKQTKRSMGDVPDFDNLAKSSRADLEKIAADAQGALSDGQGLHAKAVQSVKGDEQAILDDVKLALDNTKARVDAARSLSPVPPAVVTHAPATPEGGTTTAPADAAPADKPAEKTDTKPDEKPADKPAETPQP